MLAQTIHELEGACGPSDAAALVSQADTRCCGVFVFRASPRVRLTRKPLGLYAEGTHFEGSVARDHRSKTLSRPGSGLGPLSAARCLCGLVKQVSQPASVLASSWKLRCSASASLARLMRAHLRRLCTVASLPCATAEPHPTKGLLFGLLRSARRSKVRPPVRAREMLHHHTLLRLAERRDRETVPG